MEETTETPGLDWELHAQEYRDHIRKLTALRVPGPGEDEEELWQGPGTRFIRRIRKNAS